MYAVIDEKNDNIYKTADTRDEAFSRLNELIVAGIPGRVVQCADEADAELSLEKSKTES